MGRFNGGMTVGAFDWGGLFGGIANLGQAFAPLAAPLFNQQSEAQVQLQGNIQQQEQLLQQLDAQARANPNDMNVQQVTNTAAYIETLKGQLATENVRVQKDQQLAAQQAQQGFGMAGQYVQQNPFGGQQQRQPVQQAPAPIQVQPQPQAPIQLPPAVPAFQSPAANQPNLANLRNDIPTCQVEVGVDGLVKAGSVYQTCNFRLPTPERGVLFAEGAPFSPQGPGYFIQQPAGDYWAMTCSAGFSQSVPDIAKMKLADRQTIVCRPFTRPIGSNGFTYTEIPTGWSVVFYAQPGFQGRRVQLGPGGHRLVEEVVQVLGGAPQSVLIRGSWTVFDAWVVNKLAKRTPGWAPIPSRNLIDSVQRDPSRPRPTMGFDQPLAGWSPTWGPGYANKLSQPNMSFLRNVVQGIPIPMPSQELQVVQGNDGQEYVVNGLGQVVGMVEDDVVGCGMCDQDIYDNGDRGCCDTSTYFDCDDSRQVWLAPPQFRQPRLPVLNMSYPVSHVPRYRFY